MSLNSTELPIPSTKRRFTSAKRRLVSVKRRFTFAKRRLVQAILCLVLFNSCSGGYSFTGASINADTKTFKVENFVNRASIVQPILSSELTYALINKIRSGTNLSETSDEADATFIGTIVAYTITPSAITASDQAAKNRLTITINIKYTNRTDSKSNFDQNFTRYKEYDASLSLSSVEESLIKEINEELVDDIFTKAFVNW